MVAALRRSLADSVDLGLDAYGEWRRDRVARLGAPLAVYATLVALALVGVTLAVAGSVLGAERTASEIEAATDVVVGSGAMDLAAGLTDAFRVSLVEGQLGLVAIAALVISGWLLAAAFQGAVRGIWGTTASPRTASAHRRVGAAGVALVLAGLAATTLLLQSIGRLIGLFDVGLPLFDTTLASVLSVALLFAVLAVAFRVSAPVGVTWRAGATAALVTAEGIVGGAVVLGLYLRTVAWNSTLGAVVGLLLAAVWVVFAAQMVLVGAELTKVLHRRGSVAAA